MKNMSKHVQVMNMLDPCLNRIMSTVRLKDNESVLETPLFYLCDITYCKDAARRLRKECSVSLILLPSLIKIYVTTNM